MMTLRDFILSFTQLIDRAINEEEIIFTEGQLLLANLISCDDWLPEEYTESDPEHYRQYLLYCDPMERFSVASFVWSAGQSTPIHDHTVWGMVGVLRGEERYEQFNLDPSTGVVRSTGIYHLLQGETCSVSPRIGDIHSVANASTDQNSISIHVYGGNIGKIQRQIYDRNSNARKEFISGYSNQ